MALALEQNDKIREIVDGKRVITKKPELLAPAGSLEKLKVAVHLERMLYLLVDKNSVYVQTQITFLLKKCVRVLNLLIDMVRKFMLRQIFSLTMKIWTA